MKVAADCQLVSRYPGYLQGEYGQAELRLYLDAFDQDTPRPQYRWYFGFPVHLIDPIKMMLGTSLFWDTTFENTIDGFYLVYAQVVKPTKEEALPGLNRKLPWLLQAYNRCLNYYLRATKETDDG